MAGTTAHATEAAAETVTTAGTAEAASAESAAAKAAALRGTGRAPDAMYDVIFVVLRYTQLDAVLDTLRANRTINIVFVGNNVQTKALAAALPEKNVLFAFALSAGHREADRVVSIDLKKITIGQLTGATSNKQ